MKPCNSMQIISGFRWLVGFYGISILVGYLMTNPLYIALIIQFNISYLFVHSEVVSSIAHPNSFIYTL